MADMADPQPFETPYDRAPLDLSRLPTVRLIPPEVAGALAHHRAELALGHEMEATRLRHIADSAMSRFERASDAALAKLDEWLDLQRLPVRTPAQQERYADLTVGLERLETGLAQQWESIAGFLRTASHHEAAAAILRSGRLPH
jgi:hypothetical protein